MLGFEQGGFKKLCQMQIDERIKNHIIHPLIFAISRLQMYHHHISVEKLILLSFSCLLAPWSHLSLCA